MSTKKRRGGYLATSGGVKKLKEAKRIKKYTYEKIAKEAKETLDKVKRLFNPQWGDGKYKVGEEAVEAICAVLDLQPEEIVSSWYPEEIFSSEAEIQELVVKSKKFDSPYDKALKLIERAAKDSLEELDLSGMELTELPPEIGKLFQLQKLILGKFDDEKFDYIGNKLTKLPSEISQLTNLRKLYITANSIDTFPIEIIKLNNLTHLYLEVNSLELVSSEISQLTNLKELYINDNSFFIFPLEVTKLTKLEVLSIGGNFLEIIPAEIGKLLNLKELHLECNCLKNLPPEIGKLTNLKELQLDRNDLKKLPPEIANLKSLNILTFRYNLLSLPQEIAWNPREPANIINYCLSLQNSQKKSLDEAKMLLVGQANVGKTCIRERLIRNQYNPSRNKTDGIDIESWKIEVDKRQIQVNIWDFGGQEIMHSTHQFFLTIRSLYLLVLDSTQGEEENRLEHWLKIIQSFAKNSPVIIVGNKVDQHPLDIDKRGLQKKYPQIKAFVELSCENATGIKELEAVIKQEISLLKHIDDELPLPWFNIKTQLEDLDKDYLPYSQYESLCEAEGIAEEDKQSTLIKLLHDLGIVVNFRDDPRLEDTHVLNPEWVTNGVYKILNNRELIIEHKGILKRRMLPTILDHHRYPKNKHLFIIDMMRKFELCFDIEADQEFLIPDILPKEEPYTGEWDRTLAFEYHYPVLPHSIISRFIVRMNHYIHQHTYWRNGVVLNKEGNTALVQADREDKKITIRVKGKENTRRSLLTAIRSQFDYIHERNIPGIKPVEKVPLIEHPDIVLDYQELLGLEAMGEDSVVIGKLQRRIPLKKLLDGIETLDDRKKSKTRMNRYDEGYDA